jgi:hypothetical protein
MKTEAQEILVATGGVFIAIALAPILACSIRNRRKPTDRHWTMPVAIAVLVSWLLQIFYRIRVELPVNIQRAESRGDFEYDGVGGNVAVLMTGWLYPLVTCLAVIGVSKMISKRTEQNENGA